MRNMYSIIVDFNKYTEALMYTQGLDFSYSHTYKMKRKWDSIFNLLKPVCI